jgi:hypothetical protein
MKGERPMGRQLHEVGGVILGWIVANLLGVVAIGALGLIPFPTSSHGLLVSSLIIGLPLGFAQWAALRRVAPISILWTLTISTGLFLGIGSSISGIWGFLEDESVLSLTAAFTSIGILVGFVQWLFLRGHFAKSSVWLLSSAVGLGLGTVLVLASNLIDQSGMASIIVVFLSYTFATGLTISWLSAPNRRPRGNPVNAT